MTLAHLNPLDWTVLAIGAGLVGFAKTAVSGVGALAAVAFVSVLPAKESTGALLPLLCLGDVIAVRTYHRHADWRVLVRLLPGVLPGMVAGAWYIGFADDQVMRRTIAGVVLVMCAVQFWLRRRGKQNHSGSLGHRHNRALSATMGATAGFATMTANAAGPVTTLYLIMTGLPMLAFLGTTAWFYLVVNAAKIPFSAGLSLMSGASLRVDAFLVPALIAGALIGTRLVRRIDQRQFERAALILSAVAALALLL